MKSSELRAACEKAGLRVVTAENVEWCVYVPVGKDGVAKKRYSRHCPLLPAYVAEALKEEVYRLHGLYGFGLLEHACLIADGATPVGASPDERIRACMKILSDHPAPTHTSPAPSDCAGR